MTRRIIDSEDPALVGVRKELIQQAVSASATGEPKKATRIRAVLAALDNAGVRSARPDPLPDCGSQQGEIHSRLCDIAQATEQRSYADKQMPTRHELIEVLAHNESRMHPYSELVLDTLEAKLGVRLDAVPELIEAAGHLLDSMGVGVLSNPDLVMREPSLAAVARLRAALPEQEAD